MIDGYRDVEVQRRIVEPALDRGYQGVGIFESPWLESSRELADLVWGASNDEFFFYRRGQEIVLALNYGPTHARWLDLKDRISVKQMAGEVVLHESRDIQRGAESAALARRVDGLERQLADWRDALVDAVLTDRLAPDLRANVVERSRR